MGQGVPPKMIANRTFGPMMTQGNGVGVRSRGENEANCNGVHHAHHNRNHLHPNGGHSTLQYEKVSDAPESRVWFASKNLTPCRIH